MRCSVRGGGTNDVRCKLQAGGAVSLVSLEHFPEGIREIVEGRRGGGTLLLSIESDILLYWLIGNPADRAVCRGIWGFLPQIGFPVIRLISVRSVVQIHPGPYAGSPVRPGFRASVG